MQALVRLPWAVGANFAAMLAWVGRTAAVGWSNTSYPVAVVFAVFLLAVRPSTWSRTVREVFARQILFTGLEAMGIAVRLAGALGIMLVVQLELWLAPAGMTALLGATLMKAIVRELGPLLANMIVIGRSGTAMATEMANMRLHRETEVLESQGIDPMNYLVLPRVLAAAVSVFALSVVIIIVCFVSGYAVGVWMGAIGGGPTAFFQSIVAEAGFVDLYFFVPKTLLSALFIAAISVTQGLEIRGAATEIPQVASRSAVRSLTSVFVISAILSLLIYGRILIFQIF